MKDKYVYLNKVQDASITRTHQTSDEWCTVTLQLKHLKGTSSSYFSVTADVGNVAHYRRYPAHSWGCTHEKVAEHFPELSKYIKWHLVGFDGPRHYKANAKYWLGLGKYSDCNITHFKSTIVLGEVDIDEEMFDQYSELEYTLTYCIDDEDIQLSKETIDAALSGFIDHWLDKRYPQLMQAFDKDMRELFFSDDDIEDELEASELEAQDYERYIG